MADIGTLEQLNLTHDLDLEVFTKVKDEEVEDVDMKVGRIGDRRIFNARDPRS